MIRTLFACLLVTTALISLGVLRADEITLTNGNRVSGQIINTDGDNVTVETEFMGTVSIDRKGIASISTDEPLNITLESGELVVGKVETVGKQLTVKKEDETQLTTPVESFQAIRDDASQAAWEREQKRLTDPGWLDFWTIAADLGIAAARGNANTTTVTSGAVIQRETGFDKTTLTYEQIYSKQSTTEPFGSTANAISGGANYQRDLSEKFFFYTAAQFDFDEFQDLDLRSVLGGGLGWHILQGDRTRWDFGAGGNWNREKYSTGLTRDSAEVNIFEDSEHQINKSLRVFQSFSIFPNLSETGDYRFRAKAGAELKINSHLALTFLASNKFQSNPVSGNKKNDLLFSTGVQFNWAQK
jgi:putative salt-induced outer membrane protein YdiY